MSDLFCCLFVWLFGRKLGLHIYCVKHYKLDGALIQLLEKFFHFCFCLYVLMCLVGVVLFETFLMLHNSAIQKHHNVISDNLLPMYRHNITSLRSAETRQSLQKLLSNVSNYITDCTASNVQLIVCLFTEQHQRFALFPSCRSCFFILLLKQSDAVNWECRELQNKISGLQTNITRITEQKHKYGQFFGQSKVSIYIYIYISIHAGWNKE